MKRLYEKKDHLINRNPNLTQEQKLEIIELLGKHPSYENKIDWNRNNSLTYKDFIDILRPLYLNELDIRGLIEGEDYDVLLDKLEEKLYAIHTYNASKIIASNSVEPKIWTEIPGWCGKKEFTDEAHAFGHFDEEHGNLKPGAKWCISMQTSDNYWQSYKNDFYFFFWFRDKESLFDSNKKIAIGVDKNNWKVSVIYNGEDKRYNKDLPSYITEAIEGYKEEFKRKEKEKLLREFTLNLDTNRYDYDGNLDSKFLSNFISDSRDGFTINFGKINGYFDCSGLGLTSLKGAPTEVSGAFYCCANHFTSLEGAPKIVRGTFKCHGNNLRRGNLTSLKGAPQVVGGGFYCSYNQLTSLKGAPQVVGGGFDCSNNKLTSLKGAPKEVGEEFTCDNNQLTSLEGAPKKIGKKIGGYGYFNCEQNKLTSLEGSPQIVGGYFDCSSNKLTSLKGAPKEVGEKFACSKNQLISLEGSPEKVGGNFYCGRNPDLHSLEGIGEVKGKVYKDF